MKLKSFINAAATGLACLGMILPTDLMAAPPQSKGKPGRASLTGTPAAAKSKSASTRSKRAKKVRVIDVELAKDGSLRGEVINAKKESVKDAVISVRTAKQEIGRSLSVESGKFNVKKMPSGTYYIVAGTGHGVYRFWKNGKAPKSALSSIRIVSDRAVIRGQNAEGTVLYDEDGTAYGQVRIIDNGGLVPAPPGAFTGVGTPGMLDGLGLFDALLIAGVLTGAGFGIANYVKNEDIEDDVNAIANTPN